MRGMVLYWLEERWPVIVHMGVDRSLSNGVSEQFKVFGLPSVACCSCALGSRGVVSLA